MLADIGQSLNYPYPALSRRSWVLLQQEPPNALVAILDVCRTKFHRLTQFGFCGCIHMGIGLHDHMVPDAVSAAAKAPKRSGCVSRPICSHTTYILHTYCIPTTNLKLVAGVSLFLFHAEFCKNKKSEAVAFRSSARNKFG